MPEPEVRAALQAAYSDGSWGRYHGEYCQQLAERLKDLYGVRFAMLACSGTVAVELALRGVGVVEGQEVILAGYDFPGNFRAVEAIGAAPVVVDVDADSWCLDTDRLADACSPATKAILVSHLHGGMVRMSDVLDVAHKHELAVVEDVCQAPAARVEGRIAGTWGDAAVLSFGGSKLLTAGRGGALLTDRAGIFQRAKIFAERGNHAFPLSELQAAVVIPQLEKLPQRNQQRRMAAQRLVSKLEDTPQLKPLANAASCEPVYYKMAWRVVPAGLSRDDLVTAAQAEGLDLGAGFRGFAKRSHRRCRKVGSLSNSTRAAQTTVLLHHPVLLEDEATLEKTAFALQKVIEGMASNRDTESR